MTRLHPDWLAWPQTQTLLAAFAAQPGALRFVGGCVRDALLKKDAHDLDLATTLLPRQTIDSLTAAGIRAIPTGIDHGTVTALIDGKHFEITTLRKDTACDGRHAEVAYTEDWREDARRRDFTMNALYLSPEGELFDYHDGAKDARAGHVRFIGNPHDRIREDYLRILRFFRFYARYGKTAPDADALAACCELASHMDSLSGERIQQEMLKLLAAPGCHVTLGLMRTQGVLPHALGIEVEDCSALATFDALEIHVPPYVKLLPLILSSRRLPGSTPATDIKLISKRLKLSGQMSKTLELLYTHIDALPADERAQKTLIRKLGSEIFQWLVAVCGAMDPGLRRDDVKGALRLAKDWSPPIFHIAGDDLIALGYAPGKKLGEVLRTLEAEWEAGDYAAHKDALLARAKQLLG